MPPPPRRPPRGPFLCRNPGLLVSSFSSVTFNLDAHILAGRSNVSVPGQRKTGTYSGSHRIVQGIEPESRAEDQSPGLVTLSYLGRVPVYTLGSLRWFLLSIPANIHPLFLIYHPPSLACLPQRQAVPSRVFLSLALSLRTWSLVLQPFLYLYSPLSSLWRFLCWRRCFLEEGIQGHLSVSSVSHLLVYGLFTLNEVKGDRKAVPSPGTSTVCPCAPCEGM